MSRESERALIARAAERTGSRWLAYMARYGEPDLTPDAWFHAVMWANESHCGQCWVVA